MPRSCAAASSAQKINASSLQRSGLEGAGNTPSRPAWPCQRRMISGICSRSSASGCGWRMSTAAAAAAKSGDSPAPPARYRRTPRQRTACQAWPACRFPPSRKDGIHIRSREPLAGEMVDHGRGAALQHLDGAEHDGEPDLIRIPARGMGLGQPHESGVAEPITEAGHGPGLRMHIAR